MKSPLKTALIGCGRIGFLLEEDPLRYKPCTHYGGLKSAGMKLTHLCDINPKRLSLLAKKEGIPDSRLFTDSALLIENEPPHLAIIATWTESHAAIGISAAKAGVRVIVMEKPVTASLGSARKLIEACSKHGARIIINHERRYDSRYRAVKKIIGEGVIGDIKTVNGCILTAGHRGISTVEQGGGPLLHDGTHLIDIVRYFFGDILWVEGEFGRTGRSSGYEDRAVAWCKTAGGIDVFLEAGGNRKYFIFQLEISGTEGKIIIGNGYERLFLKRKSKLYTGFNDIGEKPFPPYRRNNCFTELYREVRSLISGKSDAVTSTVHDGYGSLEAIHAVYLSSHHGGKRIHLPITQKNIDLGRIFNLQ